MVLNNGEVHRLYTTEQEAGLVMAAHKRSVCKLWATGS